MDFFYRCSECGADYEIRPKTMVCAQCSLNQEADMPIYGVLDVEYQGTLDLNWKISDLLPVENEYFSTVPVGNTPLWEPRNIRQCFGFPQLYIKDDTLNPTGSHKDRASFLVAAFATKYGLPRVVVASTGNAASSMAGIGAAHGLEVTIFIPHNAPQAKLIQALQYGAQVIPVDGNYDRAYELSLEYTHLTGGLSRNTAYNPLTLEGKKTVALEIFRQLGRVPKVIFLPVGDGAILSGVYKGFRDLVQFKLCEEIPLIVAVQAEGSNALYRAFQDGYFAERKMAETIADSICVDVPRNGYHALRQLKRYNGMSITVTDDEILEAQRLLSSSTGLFVEPAAATSFAGFIKMKGQMDNQTTTVILVTGSGLKDIVTASKIIDVPTNPISSLADLKELYSDTLLEDNP